MTKFEAVEMVANCASKISLVPAGLTCQLELLHKSRLERTESHLGKRSAGTEEHDKAECHEPVLQRNVVDLPANLVGKLVVGRHDLDICLLVVAASVVLMARQSS